MPVLLLFLKVMHTNTTVYYVLCTTISHGPSFKTVLHVLLSFSGCKRQAHSMCSKPQKHQKEGCMCVWEMDKNRDSETKGVFVEDIFPSSLFNVEHS